MSAAPVSHSVSCSPSYFGTQLLMTCKDLVALAVYTLPHLPCFAIDAPTCACMGACMPGGAVAGRSLLLRPHPPPARPALPLPPQIPARPPIRHPARRTVQLGHEQYRCRAAPRCSRGGSQVGRCTAAAGAEVGAPAGPGPCCSTRSAQRSCCSPNGGPRGAFCGRSKWWWCCCTARGPWGSGRGCSSCCCHCSGSGACQ